MEQPDKVRARLVSKWFERAEEDFKVADHLLANESPYLTAIGILAIFQT